MGVVLARSSSIGSWWNLRRVIWNVLLRPSRRGCVRCSGVSCAAALRLWAGNCSLARSEASSTTSIIPATTATVRNAGKPRPTLGWPRQRQRLLLPVPYFLVSFTVPEALRPWIRSHLRAGLDVLFGASAQALQDLASNPKRLGAQLGMLGVLHTGSRTLIFHPHIHFLVPGGGLSPDGRF